MKKVFLLTAYIWLITQSQSNAEAVGFDPAKLDQYFFITPVSNRLGFGYFDYANQSNRLGGDSPFIKLGWMITVRDAEQTLGDINGNGQIDDNTCEYCFDPDSNIGYPNDGFPTNLNTAIAKSIEYNRPVSFHLSSTNMWAGSADDDPAVDLVKKLEGDINNVQWNQNNQVIEDDDPCCQNPALNRALTFNSLNTTIRKYGHRNMTQAAQIIANFANQRPDLFISVNIAADAQMLTWNGTGYYDYNPQTIQQFRDWLRGTGIYAGVNPDNLVAFDYPGHKRNPILTLSQVNDMAGENWTSWNQVDPPRPAYNQSDSGDLFWREWTKFRQHLVDAWIEEHMAWVASTGIPKDRIFAHGGGGYDPIYTTSFIAGHDRSASTVEANASENWETFGFNGQLDNKPMTNVPSIYTKPIFQTINSLVDRWGNFEAHNTTPETGDDHYVPTYEQSWRGLVANFNNNAHNLSPHAWHSPDISFNDPSHPSYNAFTGWRCVRGCPLEYAIKDFVGLYGTNPRGSVVYEFGNSAHPMRDDWTLINGVSNFNATNGQLLMSVTSNDPKVLTPDHIYFEAKPGDKILAKIKINGNGSTTAEFRWKTYTDGVFDNIKRESLTISANNSWQNVTFEVGDNPAWSGEIRQLRLDPTSGDEQINSGVAIDYVKILRADNAPPPSDPPPVEGDFDNDGDVDLQDFLKVVTEFVSNPFTIFDLNQVISNFGQ